MILNILVTGFPISSHPFSFPFYLVASACFILWFSGTLCRGIALTVPFENSKQHPGIFHFTEIDYFQGNTLWITLIPLLMPYFIGPIYIFFSIFTMEWGGYLLDFYIFAKRQGVYMVLFLAYTEAMVRDSSDLQLDVFLASRSSGAVWSSSAWPSLFPLARALSLHAWLPSPSLSQTFVPTCSHPNYP